jgi:hypothetical protein
MVYETIQQLREDIAILQMKLQKLEEGKNPSMFMEETTISRSKLK